MISLDSFYSAVYIVLSLVAGLGFIATHTSFWVPYFFGILFLSGVLVLVVFVSSLASPCFSRVFPSLLFFSFGFSLPHVWSLEVDHSLSDFVGLEYIFGFVFIFVVIGAVVGFVGFALGSPGCLRSLTNIIVVWSYTLGVTLAFICEG